MAMLRRDVARAVPAHAVGDDEEVVLLEHDEGVLVVLALEPDVAQPGRDCPHQGAESSNQKSLSPEVPRCQAESSASRSARPASSTPAHTSRMSFSLCAIIVSTCLTRLGDGLLDLLLGAVDLVGAGLAVVLELA